MRPAFKKGNFVSYKGHFITYKRRLFNHHSVLVTEEYYAKHMDVFGDCILVSRKQGLVTFFVALDALDENYPTNRAAVSLLEKEE